MPVSAAANGTTYWVDDGDIVSVTPDGNIVGTAPGETTVTILGTEGPRQVANHLNSDPEGILRTFAACMRTPSTYCVGKSSQVIVVLGPEHLAAIVDSGWTRERVREFLAEHSRIRPEELEAAGVLLEHGTQHDMSPGPDGKLPVVSSPTSTLAKNAE